MSMHRRTLSRTYLLVAAGVAFCLLSTPSLHAQDTARRTAEVQDDAEVIKLFNGKNLDGWTFTLRDENAKMEDVWSVTADGELICKGQPIGYIRTEESYKNYELIVEWRFDPAKGPGNSGVLLRMVGEDKVWPKSVEAQLEHRNAGDFWNIDKFPMKVALERTEGRHTTKLHDTNEKPLGEWNTYRIVVNGGTIQLYVNDLLQNEATDVEEVAGKICLQSEGAEIHFRRVDLKPLGD